MEDPQVSPPVIKAEVVPDVSGDGTDDDEPDLPTIGR